MPIPPIQVFVPLAIGVVIVVAQLSKNPFLILGSWLSFIIYMAFAINNLWQAIMKVVHPVS